MSCTSFSYVLLPKPQNPIECCAMEEEGVFIDYLYN